MKIPKNVSSGGGVHEDPHQPMAYLLCEWALYVDRCCSFRRALKFAASWLLFWLYIVWLPATRKMFDVFTIDYHYTLRVKRRPDCPISTPGLDVLH